MFATLASNYLSNGRNSFARETNLSLCELRASIHYGIENEMKKLEIAL